MDVPVQSFEGSQYLASRTDSNIMTRITHFASVVFAFATAGFAHAQSSSTFPVNGTPDARVELHVYEGAIIHVSADEAIAGGHLVVRRGRIEAVGAGPYSSTEPAVRHDLSGKEIYPSFVDLYAGWGLKKGERSGWDGKPHYDREDTKAAMGWNSALHPEYRAAEAFVPSEKAAKEHLQGGFGAVLTHRQDGNGKNACSCEGPRDGSISRNF